MALKFEEETIVAEYVKIPVQTLLGVLLTALRQGPGHLARHTPGGRDEPIAVSGKERLIDSGTVVEAFELSGGCDLQQVLISGRVLGQQQQMRRAAVLLMIAVVHAARREVSLHPD